METAAFDLQSKHEETHWSARGYDAAMRVLTRGEGLRIDERVADLVPRGSSVVDVCCGTARLYRNHLRSRGHDYLGLDANGHFIMALRQRGIAARWHDARTDPIDTADCLVMNSSLYHFHDQKHEILERMVMAARDLVIVSEPILNMSNSKYSFVRWLGRWLSNPGIGDHSKRFTWESFRDFALEAGAIDVERDRQIALAVFRGKAD